MGHALLLAGLGFGDEGKGSMVDYYARQTQDPSSTLVVRYNGGGQAAHNVILPDGTHHTFSQFGSGTLAGAKTLLSRHMLVNPLSMLNEAKGLEKIGISNPMSLVAIEEGALVTNIYQIIANRLRETMRGTNRHGSCGLGIGETIEDFTNHPDMAIRIQDLRNQRVLRRKLQFARELKYEEFQTFLQKDPLALDHYAASFIQEAFESYLERYQAFAATSYRQVYRSYLGDVLKGNHTAIFEGAQGVLLDQDYGFFPHVTRSTTTFKNAEELLADHPQDYSINRVGVIRAYSTRHGAGPFPTEQTMEDVGVSPDEHNDTGQFQGSFRYGDFDFVLLNYALQAINGVDEIVVTNIDRLPMRPRACVGYQIHDKVCDSLPLPSTREEQTALTESLKAIDLDYGVVYDRTKLLISAINGYRPVNLVSIGPTHKDKIPTEELRM